MMSQSTKSWGRLVLSRLGMGAGIVLASGQAFGQCTGQWDTSFRAAQADGTIRASVMHDDGSGPALFVGGSFTTIGGSIAWGIAKTHDGVTWERLGEAFFFQNLLTDGAIYDMVSFDPDGPGPLSALLVVAGTFHTANNNLTPVDHIAAWDGTSWQSIGGGLPSFGDLGSFPHITSLAVVNHASGPKLYAGGDFEIGEDDPELGFINGRDIAVWNGTTWGLLGQTGVTANARVVDLFAHNDGGGEDLYVAIEFGGIIGVPNTGGIARFDGTAWSDVGGGIPAPFDGGTTAYSTMVSFDADGPGGQPAKLMCFAVNHQIFDGNFSSVGRIDMFNGTSWDVVNMPYFTGFSEKYGALPVTDASGRAVYFGVIIPQSASFDLPRASLARYDGTSFSLVGTLPGAYPSTMTLNTLDTPATLFVGQGNLEPLMQGTGLLSYHVDTGQYSKMNTVMGAPANDQLEASRSFSMWHPQWDDIAGNDSGGVSDLALYDPDASGPLPETEVVLVPYSMAGVVCNGVAIRSGSSWAQLGDTSVFVPQKFENIGLSHIVAMPTASGTELFVAGRILTRPNPCADPEATGCGDVFSKAGVFKLVNGVWQPLGTLWGIEGAFAGENVDIQSMVYADFGSGNELYIMGRLTRADGTVVSNAAKWNGSAWVAAGSGLPNQTVFGGFNNAVVHTDSNGTQIFLGGYRFDGSVWESAMLGLPDTSPQFAQHRVVKFNGALWAARPWTDSESRSRSTLYRWSEEAGWEFQLEMPAAGATSNDSLQFIGVANNGTGDSFYFGKFDTSISTVSASVMTSDGVTALDVPAMGRFSFGNPFAVKSTSTRGEHSLWFLGTNGVGGEYTPVHNTTINAMDSYGVARWYCTVPTCPADHNQSGSVTVQDIFDFLAGWFAGSNAADFNNSGSVTVQDIFDFLAAWFAGCP